jgi:uncharacterized protein
VTHCREFSDAQPDQAPVRGFLHLPQNPSGMVLILTHGAGANANSPLLIAFADAFCAVGMAVLRCDLNFRLLKPHGPPPRGSAVQDQLGLRAAVMSMRQQTTGQIFLGGHSYGGRQASMLAAAEPGLVDGLLLLSYPLHPPRRPEELRTTHFPKLQTPALFVHGARDTFGTIEEVDAALKLVSAPTRLLTVAGAGHELLTSRNRDELPEIVVRAFQDVISLRRE